MRRLSSIMAFVLLLGLSACTPKPEKPEEPANFALAVFLDTDVTAAQKSAVEQRLRAMPSVENVYLESRAQVYERQKEQLKDNPNLLARLRPEDMPETFNATITDAPIAEAVELVMAGVDGVQDVALRIVDVDDRRPARIGVIVRSKSSATEEQRATLEAAVRALPNTDSVEFEDRDAAYERLRTRCRGKGDLATQLEPQMVRESWRFNLPLNHEGAGVSDLIELDGVDVVRLVPAALL
ncbi:permease-like cell division protein FtsX [Micromonospora lupini]|uniref:permease-like cell division protein FtsX n=1 Tax=Micromonospora lupini TaxID=285679 RepID=UPI0033F665F7